MRLLVKLPKMRMVGQRYTDLPTIDVSSTINQQWDTLKGKLNLRPGAKIAIAVGSRGIADLAQIVRIVVEKLKDSGGEPFIVPAMGSHGGATGEGQAGALAGQGITERRVGVPIRATMEVAPLGEVDGIPLFLDRFAAEADGIVLINRVKPHTNFVGPTESGLLKMIAIGLGNQIGAEHYHRLSMVRSQYEIISTAGRELLKRAISHRGYSLVDILQPCVSFNKVNTYSWFKDHTYNLENSHDPGDREGALRRAMETERLPLGLFYLAPPRPTFEDHLVAYSKDSSPLYRRAPVKAEKILSLLPR